MRAMPPRGIVIGILLQIAAFATGYLNIRFLYAMGWFGCLVISVPLFLASPFYIMRAPAPLWLRLLLSFWLLGIPLSLAAETAWERLRLRPEIVLVPPGFHGKATVYFSDPAGAPEVVEGGKLVLRLGANGELRTLAQQRKFSSDWVDSWYNERREFYFLEPSGQRIKLETITVNDAPDRAGAISMGTGYDAGRLLWVEFYIGTPGEWLKSMEKR